MERTNAPLIAGESRGPADAGLQNIITRLGCLLWHTTRAALFICKTSCLMLLDLHNPIRTLKRTKTAQNTDRGMGAAYMAMVLITQGRSTHCTPH